MRIMGTLAKRDLCIWFAGWAGFLVPIAYALLSAGLFFGIYGFFDVGQAEMRGFFHYQSWIFLFLLPALAMGSFAAERYRKDDVLLRALPVSEWEWVGGKFLAGLVQIGVCLVATVPVPIMLSQIGNPDWGPVVTAYGGAFLLAAAMLAWSQLISDLFRSQVAAFVVAALLLFVWLLIGNAPVISAIAARFAEPSIAGRVTRLLDALGWIAYYANLGKGLADSASVAYFVLVALTALALHVALLRWRRIA